MIIIIGAGLSGLLTAYRLKKEGIPFKILEARSRVGGRIHSVNAQPETLVEMGATWFGDYHHNLIKLLDEMGVGYFEQFMTETAFYQAQANVDAQLIEIPKQTPSYRITGGSSAILNALYETLDENDILFNQLAAAITFTEQGVQVSAGITLDGDAVVLALPPKLWAMNMHFEPELPHALKTIALNTQTWMEDSIKIALTYPEPFWEQPHLSATLFSNAGPIIELYDHCNRERSTFALCGFINAAFKTLPDQERQALVIQQLKKVFGKQAEDYIEYVECIWSHDLFTYTSSEVPLLPHQNNGNPIFTNSYYDERLLISSAEASPQFPGYMDGAVYMGNTIAEKIIERFK